MSKENSNLRLLGSPVNLTYRSKRKDDKKNVRNRPRSALQNSCFTPDLQEKYKRPFSADAKERAPSTRSFLKTFSAEILQSYNSSPTTVKVVAPTTELLGDFKSPQHQYIKKDKEICSNASDYGSEDTFISLGTKIKAKAQLGPKIKSPSAKNILKYRNIAKRGRKVMDNVYGDKPNDEYGLEIKITERPPRASSPTKNKDSYYERSLSPSFKTRSYESYFIPLESDKKSTEDSLEGRVSFGTPNIQAEVEEAIDTYSRRLTLTKQQLSLVEEESTQDLESVPSQNLSSLSPENSLNDANNVKEVNLDENLTGRNTYVVDLKDDAYPKTQNFMSDPRTYSSFYDDFRTNTMESYAVKMSSTVVHTDASSKDSGYPDSGANDEKVYKQNYSLPHSSSSILKKSSSHTKIEDQPKSLDSVSTSSNDKYYHKTFPLDKKWTEPLNHSRLLYKDFFIKKEGHVALPPQNSPTKSMSDNMPSTSEGSQGSERKNNKDLEYPSYLVNSTTKAYTSKVIEDYKRELEAINNLHELTLKDIQSDAISPTPLNIDRMFEQNSTHFVDDKKDSSENSQESSINEMPKVNNNSLENSKRDVSKISTKELIQNYLKVKEGDYSKDYIVKNLQKYDKKPNNSPSDVAPRFDESTMAFKQSWNNKNTKPNSSKAAIPVHIRNQTQKNLYSNRIPMSARIEGVQNDKDIDSWMSLSAPSPRILEIEEIQSPVTIPEQTGTRETVDKVEVETTPPSTVVNSAKESKEPPKPKELSSNSTVFDIYSMLKEIESYGDNPVTSVVSHQGTVAAEPESKKEEENTAPKDHFMEIFEFLEKVEQSANDALSVVTNTTPQTVPKLESLLKLPQTELAQRLVTLSLQLEERSCCIALLQESLTNHKEQMISKVSNLEKQSIRNISKVKQECEETIKRHQNFIDQLINDKKTLNHRIEQLVDERRALEERWKRSAQALEERYKLELRNQHDKMAAAQQVARQRWVRQKAEKIKELTVKGLEGELREMAERQQKEVSDLKMLHAEQCGRSQAKHSAELEELRRTLEAEKEAALVKERQLASSRLEKQILEIELTYQEQRTRLVAEMRAENERAAAALAERERQQRAELEMRAENERAAAALADRERQQRAELEMRAENERAAAALADRERQQRAELEMRAENERAAAALADRERQQRAELGERARLGLLS
ncbi:centrosomal protein of 131 kDa-like [Ostrinia nubilalis]|uniref:centrosomal protein of 131 kDa-like n=1 Tax=Ostrinia nubilalis TaxID=29057 RepID=UPI0030823651